MKNCIHCQTPIEDRAAFCPQCGKSQEQPAAVNQAAPQPAAPQPQPVSQGQPIQQQQQPVPQGQAVQPQQPAPQYQARPAGPPSQLARDGKRYFAWLWKGIFGTTELIHLLFAAIVPFVLSLFYTLGAAPNFAWHAGGFFLVWFFAIIIIGGLPVLVWLIRKLMFKEQTALKAVVSRYSSQLNIVLPYSLLVFIIQAAAANSFFRGLNDGVLIFALISAVACFKGQPQNDQEIKKTWLAYLALAGFFVLLSTLITVMDASAYSWVLRSGW